MKKLFVALVMLLMPSMASALVITEIMHSPLQGSDTNLEWIEVYNDGSESIDLSSWKIGNSNFDDYVIIPGEYLVIARKLILNQSFESVWGNNNSVWDEDFAAIDGSFSLPETGTINLSDGITTITAIYAASSFTNGATVILVNGSYVEGTLNGTPGFPEYSSDEVAYSYDNENLKPEIIFLNVTDEYSEEGFQVNSPKLTKSILVIVNATDANGDLLNMTVSFNGESYNAVLDESLFIANITIYSNSTSSDLIIKVDDGLEITEKVVRLDIIKRKSYSLSKNAIRFSKTNSSGISTASFTITNNGDLPAVYSMIALGNGEKPEIYLDGNWVRLSNDTGLPELIPNGSFEVKLRIKPGIMKKGRYYGKLKVSAR